MNNTIDKKNAFALLLANHQHIHENIKFADQKAGFFVTLNGAALAFVYSLIKSANQTVTIIVGFAVCSLLIAGIGLGLHVIWPRGSENRKRGPGVVDADRIYQFGSDKKFVARCETIPDGELLQETRMFIYDRSRISYQKYRSLKISIVVSSIGWLGALSFAAWVRFHP